MPTISVVIPAYNEQNSLAQTLRAVKALPYTKEIIVINDGSTDHTIDIASQYSDYVIHLTKNYGKGYALQKAFQKVKGDFILCLDADLGESASEANLLIEAVINHKADLVISKMKPGRQAGFGFIKKRVQTLIWKETGVRLESPLSGQRVFHRKWLPYLLPIKSKRFGIETEMNVRLIRARASILEIETSMMHREMGRTLKGVWHRYKQWIDIKRVWKEV
ncbi:putative glycosyltransferase [Bacillus sp. TS-2]|nr:putative glycosyltransferase [Bacillus sp. TS-2]